MNRKTLFDTVRRMLGRSFRQHEVEILDRALDAASDDSTRGSVPSRQISPAGLQLIKTFEGCARLRPDGFYQAYPDPGTGGAPWTIGWGATGADIGPDTVWTQEQCDARLEADVVRHARDVAQALDGCPATQGQFDALVSFHYNTGAINRASLTRFHRQGEYARAAEEFARWKYAGGQVLKGLVRRRREEAKHYRSCGFAPES